MSLLSPLYTEKQTTGLHRGPEAAADRDWSYETWDPGELVGRPGHLSILTSAGQRQPCDRQASCRRPPEATELRRPSAHCRSAGYYSCPGPYNQWLPPWGQPLGREKKYSLYWEIFTCQMPDGASTRTISLNPLTATPGETLPPPSCRRRGWAQDGSVGRGAYSSGSGPLLSIHATEQGPGHRLQPKPALPTHSCVVYAMFTL